MHRVLIQIKLGAVAAMLNHNQRGEVLSHSIKLVKAKLLVVSDECGEAIESTEFTRQKRRVSVICGAVTRPKLRRVAGTI